MKRVTAIENALKQDHAIKAIPEVIIDWNMNRYLSAVADNTPSDEDEGYDVEMFPISSIIRTNRPGKGILKARVGQSMVGEDYRYNTNAERNGRYYIADVDDSYKYWTSPGTSNGTGVISKVKPQVVYAAPTAVNKLVIATENSWASAKTFEIQVTTVAAPTDSSWVTVATQATMGNAWKASGKMVLYYDGTGSTLTSWTTASRSDYPDKTPRTVAITGVRLIVTSLEGGYKTTKANTVVPSTYKVPTTNGGYEDRVNTGFNSNFDLIEISAHLEVDLTPYVISYSTTTDMAEASAMYPIGTITSNQGSLNLSNLYRNGQGKWVPGLFSANNANSPYKNYIEPNAEVSIFLNYTSEAGVSLGRVQECKMYVDSWNSQADDEVSVDLTDYSKFFDTAENKLRSAMWEGLTVPEIIWRIMDSIGFSDYQVDYDADFQTDHIIPIFYTDGEENVWEVLDELSKASQTAIYFDSFGILQVKTRKFAFSPAAAPVWDFTSVDAPRVPANIASLDLTTEFESNSYKVTYSKTDWAPANNGQPTLQQVWTPEAETVTLRATPLLRTMELDSTWAWISPADIKLWPYEGMINVQGELMKFKGKIFRYYTGADGNTVNQMVIDSDDEFKARNNLTPLGYRNKNGFTGALKLTERGVWNSENKRHTVEAEGYSIHQLNKKNFSNNVTGFSHDKAHSRVQLLSPFTAETDIRLATRGQSDDQPFFNYGTRFRFLADSGRVTQHAGLVINNAGTQEDGYFIEFTPSVKLDGKGRASRDEVFVYSRVGGKINVLGRAAAAIAENIDYEVDVTWATDGAGAQGVHTINVWLNGKLMVSAKASGANRAAGNGKFGMFVAGSTRAEFEYLYAIRREEESPLLEDFSFLDKVETGYMGGQWDREWVYRWKNYRRRVKKKWKKEQMRFNRTFFDEFGPIVHELREYDVKFDPAPVQHSRLYLTNDWSGLCLEYRSDPFGAKFVIANTARRNAVIHGEDALSFSGTDDTIAQVLTVLGRGLVTEEGEEVLSENIDQIRRRGKIEGEISSPWIQSKKMAQDVADWMKDNFSYGNEQVSIEVFGNPFIEIGDVVTVNYPDKHISGNFFVLSVNNEFETGYMTTLGLRRRI